MRSLALFVSALSLLALAACGSSSNGTGGAGTTTSNTTTSTGNGGSSTTTSDTGGSGGATSTTSSTTSSTGTGGSIPVAACSDISAEDCFSNLDCMAADRCENKGTSDVPVPCCVPGARGTGKSGDACSVDNDCQTSLCIETAAGYRCSGECMSDNDCPAELPSCTEVPAILGQGSFCFPS